MSIGKLLDEIVRRGFFISKAEIEKDKAFFGFQSKAHNEPSEAMVLRFLDDIDAKSSALLSHVSMMIAVLSISISTLDFGIYTSVAVIFEIALYIFVALGCLRCLEILSSGSFETKEIYNDFVLHEAAVRRTLYRRCRSMAVFATFAFLVSVLVHYFTIY